MRVNWQDIFTSYIDSFSRRGVPALFKRVASATNPYGRGTDDAKAFDQLNVLLSQKYPQIPLRTSAEHLLERLNGLQHGGLNVERLTLPHLAIYDEAYQVIKADKPGLVSTLDLIAVKLINAGYTPETFVSIVGDFTYLTSNSNLAEPVKFKQNLIKLLDEVKSSPRVLQAYASVYRSFFDLGWLENSGGDQLMNYLLKCLT